MSEPDPVRSPSPDDLRLANEALRDSAARGGLRLGSVGSNRSGLGRSFAVALLCYLIFAGPLFKALNHPDLHTMADTTVLLTTVLLACLLWDVGSRSGDRTLRSLAIVVAAGAFWEMVHALVALDLVEAAIPLSLQGVLSRPSTWPPPAHLLPLGALAALALSRRARVSLEVFGGALLLQGAAVWLLFQGIPPYAAEPWHGITRPSLLLVPLLWLAAGAFAYRQRKTAPLLVPLALAAVIMVIAHAAMLFSRSPHDTLAMVAHLGKAAGLLFLLFHVVEARGAALREIEAAGRDAAAVVESTDDAVITTTLQGVITSWNPAAERIFGYTAQEALELPVLSLMPSERAHEDMEILSRIAGGERVEHFETVRIRKDGRRLDVSVAVSPLRDHSGRIVGASKILRDITERKATTEALQTLGVRLTTTLENMDAAFFTVDHDWRFTYLNKECERLLRCTRDQLLGKELWVEFKDAIGGPSDLNYHLAVSESRAVWFEEFYPPPRDVARSPGLSFQRRPGRLLSGRHRAKTDGGRPPRERRTLSRSERSGRGDAQPVRPRADHGGDGADAGRASGRFAMRLRERRGGRRPVHHRARLHRRLREHGRQLPACALWRAGPGHPPPRRDLDHPQRGRGARAGRRCGHVQRDRDQGHHHLPPREGRWASGHDGGASNDPARLAGQ